MDLRGVLVEPTQYIFGLRNFEQWSSIQFENIESDTVVYGLKKLTTLCLQGNPNTLELLGVDDDCIVICTEAGRLLRENVDIFLSREVIRSFGNYAIAQLRRLQNALARDSCPQKEKEKHILDTLNTQMEHFKTHYASFDNDSIQLYTDKLANSEYEQHCTCLWQTQS